MTSRFELEPIPAAVRTARSTVLGDDLLADLTDGARRDIALITSELVTNAVAATSPRRAPIVVELHRDGSSVTIVVSNAGRLQVDDTTFDLPAAEEPRGRGLGIVAMLSRAVEMTNEDGTTTVRAVVETGS